MSDPHPDKDLQAVEQALQSLSPNPGHLDRDRLMWGAGRVSARASRLWPLAALASSTVAALLAVVIVLRPAPEPIVQIVHVPVMKSDIDAQPAATPTSGFTVDTKEPANPHGYARLQDHLLRWGLDLPALPSLPEGQRDPYSETRIERGGVRTSGLFTSWLLSRGAN